MTRIGWLLLLPCACAAPRSASDTITAELLTPYATALAAGDVDEARLRFTTPGYQREVSAVLYAAGQARNRDEVGAGLELRLSPDMPVPVREPGRPELLRVTVTWAGADGELTAVLDLVDGPPWRIERSWVWPADGLATPRVF